MDTIRREDAMGAITDMFESATKGWGIRGEMGERESEASVGMGLGIGPGAKDRRGGWGLW